MGNYLQSSPTDKSKDDASLRKSLKRPLEEGSDDDLDQLHEEQLHTPKKRKLQTTSRYIYETLFLNGANSDVTITALGRPWLLHKVYLCQSTYFSSMFSGSWRESSEKAIHIDIPDDNISIDALQIAFGSLYKDDVAISPAQVISVLAAATLLGLDGLIQQCAAVMQETISLKTVCIYHQAASMYGREEVSRSCLEWLCHNLLIVQSPELLAEISCSLLGEVLTSASLFVIQVEMDIYSLLKKWVFLQCTDNWTGTIKELQKETDGFFKEQKGINGEDFFLETEMGSKFASVFQCLRLQYILNDGNSVRVLEEDNIIPQEWLMPLYKKQWLQMLKVEQSIDKGPTATSIETFCQHCVRCGRILPKEGEFCWRWTGFNYGVDLLVSVSRRLVILKRNCHAQNTPGSISLQPKRDLYARVTVAQLDKLGQITYKKMTGLKKLSLGKDEEIVMLGIDRSVVFPVYISCNFLVYTPKETLLNGEGTPPQNISQSDAEANEGSNQLPVNPQDGADPNG